MDDALRDNIAQLTPEQRAKLEARLRTRRSEAPSSQITPRADRDTWPMSPAQMRIWSLNRLRPDDATYNMQRAWRLEGPLNVAALAESLSEVMRRHETLRARFMDHSGTPEMLIRPIEPLALSAEPIPNPTRPDAVDQAKAVAKADAERPFDLAHQLVRVRLLQLASDDHVLIMTTHHLVCDGWSMDLIERELSAVYESILRGTPLTLAPLPVEYADYAIWQSQRRDGPDGQRELAYWTDRLQGPVAPLELPGRRQSHPSTTLHGGHLEISLDRDLTAAINQLSRDARVTPFMTLLTGLQLALHEASGQDDIVLCTPAAGRIHLQTEALVGYFNNLVVLRADLSSDLDVRQLLESNRTTVLGAFDHQGVAFQDVASLPDVAFVPLARGLIVLQETSQSPLQLAELEVTPLAVEAETADFEFALFMREVEGRYRSVVRFRRDVLAAEDVDRLMSRFANVLRSMVESPDTRHSVLVPVAAEPAVPNEASATSPRSTDGGVGSALPASLLESQLLEIWRRLFKNKSISRSDDFFELGGHSLLAAEMLADVENQIVHEPMPLATLFQAPTVAELAQVIADGGWSQSWASLVPIQPNGSQVPFFFVHPHGGNVLGYHGLAQRLGGDQPFYGLQAPEVNSTGTEIPPRRIEEMASRYVDELRHVQPRGPYLIGGECFGADVAFEMAQQLDAAGEEVAALVMVDNPRDEFLAQEPSALAQRLSNRVLTRIHRDWTNLAEVPWHRKPLLIVRRVRNLARKVMLRFETVVGKRIRIPHSATYKRAQIEAAHMKAYEAYLPKPYPGKVALVRAEHQPFGRPPDETLGWGRYVERPIEVIQAPGHRAGLLAEPRVVTVAELIRGVLSRAVADHDEPGT